MCLVEENTQRWGKPGLPGGVSSSMMVTQWKRRLIEPPSTLTVWTHGGEPLWVTYNQVGPEEIQCGVVVTP